jgi:hypothetical protein
MDNDFVQSLIFYEKTLQIWHFQRIFEFHFLVNDVFSSFGQQLTDIDIDQYFNS